MVGEEKGGRDGRNRRQEAHSLRDIEGDQKRTTRCLEEQEEGDERTEGGRRER
jgi:hypothetical protein